MAEVKREVEKELERILESIERIIIGGGSIDIRERTIVMFESIKEGEVIIKLVREVALEDVKKEKVIKRNVHIDVYPGMYGMFVSVYSSTRVGNRWIISASAPVKIIVEVPEKLKDISFITITEIR